MVTCDEGFSQEVGGLCYAWSGGLTPVIDGKKSVPKQMVNDGDLLM